MREKTENTFGGERVSAQCYSGKESYAFPIPSTGRGRDVTASPNFKNK
jgi:hypothetical protein